MKKILSVLFLFSFCFAQAQEVTIIPQPSYIKVQQGTFTVSADTKIIEVGRGTDNSASFLNDYLKKFYGFQLQIVKETKGSWKNAIVLNYEKLKKNIPGAYVMTIDKDKVYIGGDNETGVFYGVQSLLQLLPVVKKGALEIPQLNITDSARFAYRGMMLDVCRHFFTIENVKKYIDLIAMYKFNTFHWHLTDDQGWRIEIKKYPKLTQVGSCRAGTIIGRYPGTGNDSIKYCGYYTQEQIKEIVKYAADRYITVVPEIEMPGHSSAALTAYPELGCTGGPYKVQETWGVFKEVYCAGNEKTFSFLEDVLDEVMSLFPSQYIHVGGDECPKDSWKVCPKCQQRIKDNHLKDEHALQSYFIQRIEKYVNNKGKKIIGWDEILEGGLAPNAAVMSWRGEKGGIEAAKQKHNVIMTPGDFCYLDKSQSKNEDSVTIGGYLPVEKVYAYEPIPKELNASEAKYVMGAQANLWTEYIGSERKLDYMVFPRLSALSEVLWSPKENRNWKDFERRLLVEFTRYDQFKVNYSKAYYDLKSVIQPAKDYKGIVWALEGRTDEDEIAVTKMNDDKQIATGKKVVAALIQEDGKYKATSSKSTSLKIAVKFNKATGKKITSTTPPADRYPGIGGIFGLVNGITSEKAVGSEWLGWNGKVAEVIIDLGDTMTISSVNAHVSDQRNSWVYHPSAIEVLTSNNPDHFTATGKTTEYLINTDKGSMGDMKVSFSPLTTRYIKVIIKPFGIIPDGLPGEKNTAWSFVDEISVN
ncbi:family 20 glycosylhydrolase [Chitinophagaceae bacterium LWZ2-11]